MLELTQILTRFVAVIASFFVFIYFLKDFFEVRNYPRLLRSLSFLAFFISASLALTLDSNPYSGPALVSGMTLLYVSLVLDQHSHLRYTLPLPFLAILFLKEYQLLSLSIMNVIALLELAYSTEHKKIIIFVTVFTLVAIAQYFHAFEPALGSNAAAAQILYLIAGFIIMIWLLFYMIKKMISLFRGKD